jgi:cell division protein FtsN
MRKVLIFTLLLAFTLSGCRLWERFRADKGADTLAVWQQRQDSLKRDEMLKTKRLEELRRAKEKTIQDSLMRVREFESRNRYHVIIGSFKIPTNANDFQKHVATLGFQNAKVVESPNGFKMVSVGTFETYSKAANEILRVNRDKAQPIEMWIFKAL